MSSGETAGSSVERGIKRAFDLVGASLGLAVLSPVMAGIAVAVRLESPGPALFRQPRLGRHGQEFEVLKFRTMVVGAGDGAVSTNDARLTRLGGPMRRWSLDELPQLINVVRGEMSIVGPRPDRTFRREQYSDAQRRRLWVRPGITGLAQVSGRNALDWEARNHFDVRYVDEWSLALDLEILARTLSTVVFGRGVNFDPGKAHAAPTAPAGLDTTR